MGIREYAELDATELARLVQTREVSAAELMDEAIRRLEAVDPRLNLVVHRMYDRAREAAARSTDDDDADRPFAGVPFLLKDLMAYYAGEPIRMGSRATEGFVPDHDSELVRRFKKSGLITFAKTNTPEFGLAPVTEPELFGPTLNPWNPAKTPSGSSGGSAAAVAARVVPMAHANDGGGSIRTPASCCGLFGLKPSRGRLPTGPDYGEVWQGSAVEGVVSRSVRDCARLLDAVAGPDVGAAYVARPPQRPYEEEARRDPPRLRIALCRKPLIGTELHADCGRAMDITRDLLTSLGHEVDECELPFDREAFIHAFAVLVVSEAAADIDLLGKLRGKPVRRKDVESVTWLFTQIGRAVSGHQLSLARRSLDRMNRDVSTFMAKGPYDLILTPTLGKPPVDIGALAPTLVERAFVETVARTPRGGAVISTFDLIEPLVKKTFDFSAYTAPFNTTGQPAMSVPLHWNDEGLPVGSQFVASHGDESTLFALAGQLERARPWKDRKPPICS